MEWHYQDPRTGARNGPTSQEVLADKLAGGELGADALVWRPGMQQWAPASRRAEFAGVIVPTAAAVVAPMTAARGSIGYFAPRTDTPSRVRRNLQKYATATGPVGDWPLDDAHIDQLADAVRHRKRVLSAYNLIRLVAVLELIIFVIMFIGAVGTIATARGSIATQAWLLLVPAAIFGAFAALGFACGHACWYCRSWGALVMAILTTIGAAAQVVSTFLAAFSSQRDAIVMALANAFGVLISAAFAYVYWRGWASTGRYLNTPVWCQEALAVADRAK